jgi:type II secretory pathway component PulF
LFQKKIVKEDGTKQALRDYGGFLLYFAPCLFVLAFTNVILVPRFEMVMAKPEEDFPAVLSTMISTFRYFVQYFFFVVPALIIGIVFAEVFSRRWRAFRSIFFSAARFLIVLSTLIVLLILATTTLVLVPMVLKS